MDNPSKKSRCYSCDICVKQYSSYKSLWNHNNKFHRIQVSQLSTESKSLVSQKSVESKPLIYLCKYCKAEYKHKQSKWKHEQKCQTKVEIKEVNTKLVKKVDKLEQQLKILMKKTGKININNNINNGTIINNIVKFGEISYDKLHNDREIRDILKCQYKSLEESIKQTHFNKDHPEYNNIFITNMRDNLAYIFDGNKMIAITKTEVLTDLIDMHMIEINLS